MQESHISLSITPKEAARVYYAILKDEEYYYDNQYCKNVKMESALSKAESAILFTAEPFICFILTVDTCDQTLL